MMINVNNIFYLSFPLEKSLLRVAAMVMLASLAVLQAGCNQMSRPASEISKPDVAAHVGVTVKVVAAGLIRGDGTHIGPVNGGLKVIRVDTGELVIAFDGYRMPDDKAQYVIKVLPVNSSARASLLNVYFIEYLPDGVRFNVRRSNANLGAEDLRVAQFMMEVSLIE